MNVKYPIPKSDIAQRIKLICEIRVMGPSVLENNENFELKGAQISYNVFAPEKCPLRLKNDYFWKISY